MECSGDSIKEVRECVIPECNLYLYRMGKNPSRKGQGGPGNIEALRKWREKEEAEDDTGTREAVAGD